MSEYRGRGRGGFRGRGGPPRGFRGGGRGGFSDRDSGDRGGFRTSRGRGGPPRRMDRDDSPPPRKMSMMSSRFDSDRPSRRDRFDDEYDREPLPRSRDFYPREDRIIDRLTPPRSFKDRDFDDNGYSSARGEFLPLRSRSPLLDSRDSYPSRVERRGPPARDFPSRSGPRGGFRGERPSRDFRDLPPKDYPRDFGDGRDDLRDSFSMKDSFRSLPPRDRFSSRDQGMRDLTPPRRGPRRDDFDSREERPFNSRGFSDNRGGPRDYPPAREFRGRGGRRGGRDSFSDDRSPRGDRDEFSGRGRRGGRDDFSGGPRGRGGPSFRDMGGPPRGRGGRPPRGRGRPDFEGRGERRSSYDSRDAPLKRPRSDLDDEYDSRR